ncbi:MAG TPA: hypothetical protein PKX05_03010 [bacterium]|nr:hypothetical protein [bacterium]
MEKRFWIFFLVCLMFVFTCGCEKKQKMPQPESHFQSISAETKISAQTPVNKNSSKQMFYPIKQEKKTKPPAWFEQLISINNQYYEAWREKTESNTSQAAIALLFSSDKQPISSSPSFIPSGQASSKPQTVQSPYTSVLKQPSTQGSISQSSGGGSISTGTTSSQPADPGKSTQPAEQNPPPAENPPSGAGVNVIRSIQPFTGGAYVRLNINVSNNKINGIIITENIPESYTVASAAPGISKRTGNSVKWLFYGASLTSQTINYELRGTGKATISGSFSSSLGSGSITGDSSIGE